MSTDLKLAKHYVPSVSFGAPCAFYSSEELCKYYFLHFTDEEPIHTVLDISRFKLSI